MRDVVWMVVFLFVAYAVARFLVFLKKKTERKWRQGRKEEGGGDREIIAVVIAGVAAHEEDVGVGKKRSKRSVRVKRGKEHSWWRAAGRTE